jgi:hypothetical protein
MPGTVATGSHLAARNGKKELTMAEIRVQRKKGIPLIWLLLALIILVLAIWFLIDRMGDDENASLAPPELQEPWRDAPSFAREQRRILQIQQPA